MVTVNRVPYQRPHGARVSRELLEIGRLPKLLQFCASLRHLFKPKLSDQCDAAALGLQYGFEATAPFEVLKWTDADDQTMVSRKWPAASASLVTP